MRRLNLSTKMLVAALPLLIAVVGLLAISVRSDLNDIDGAEHGAELGGVWRSLLDTLGAIEYEADADNADAAAARATTNTNVNDLGMAVAVVGASEAASDHITRARSELSTARSNLDMATLAPELQTEIDPTEAYAAAGREIVAVGELLPAEAGDPDLGRELLAVVKLADAKLAADQVSYGVAKYENDPTNIAALTNARSDFGSLDTLLGEFEAIAPEEWSAQLRQTGFGVMLSSYRTQLDQATRAAQTGETGTFDAEGFDTLVDGLVEFQTTVSNEIVERANADADATSSATLRRIGVILAITLVAVLLAWIISRSITKRIKAVAKGANQVSTEQLPALVSALHDPRGKGTLPTIERIPARGTDELAELAGAFNSMQDTLVDVAQEQVEVMRRGVSDIFITMARRNRSLIDRQLAMLDEFEAEVDDAEVLSNYYQLDHMATRMRRNSESLLVLANAEPKRRRVRATEVDDVVRAAIGEVEDYRRIEIEALESLQVRGNVVADVSHLLAELLDNATSFSPPDSHVRVGGRMSQQGYMIRIVDNGVGIGTERLKELNELLREPPVVGLSVESTLGMSVVSLLAHKHDIAVNLAAGNPGLIVDVILPQSLFGPIDVQPAGAPTTAAVVAEPVLVDQVVAWDDSTPDSPADETFEVHEPITAYTPDEDVPVVQGDWRSMSLNLAAFQSGMRQAETATPAETSAAAEPPVHVAPGPESGTERDMDEVGQDEVESDDVGPMLPPPAAAPRAEFAVPPAPPMTANSPSLRPVTPDNARTVNRPVEVPTSPSLPTRSPSQGPDGGPDRLANALDSALPTRTPSEGPDGGHDRLSGDNAPIPLDAPDGSLPTRARVGDPVGPIDEPLATAPSPSDPDALRDRLRAFQAEFRSALGSDNSTSDDNDMHHDTTANDHRDDQHSDHNDRDGQNEFDLGGDRR